MTTVAATEQPTRSRRLVWLALGIVAAFVVLLAPRPSGDVADHLHKEDGSIFLADALASPGLGLTEPYTGYQHWWPRLIAEGCAELPADGFVQCVTWSSHSFRIVLAIAAYFLLAPVLRRRGSAALAASMFVLVPMGQQEVLGNLTNLRWFGDAFAVLALSVRVVRWRVAVPVAFVAGLCALTDPLALLIAPLALWHVWRPPGPASLVVPVSFVGATGLHWWLLEAGARSADVAGVFSRTWETTEQLLVRGVMVPQFGQNGSEGLILVAGLPIALMTCALPLLLLGLGLRRLEPSMRWALAIWLAWSAGLLLVTISFADSQDIALTEYWRIGQASRYSVVPAVLVGMGLVVCACTLLDAARRQAGRWPRLVALAGVVALVAAIAVDWPGDSYNTQGPNWADTVREARASCEDGRELVTVLVTPTGVPTRWDAVLTCAWLD